MLFLSFLPFEMIVFFPLKNIFFIIFGWGCSDLSPLNSQTVSGGIKHIKTNIRREAPGCPRALCGELARGPPNLRFWITFYSELHYGQKSKF